MSSTIVESFMFIKSKVNVPENFEMFEAKFIKNND